MCRIHKHLTASFLQHFSLIYIHHGNWHKYKKIQYLLWLQMSEYYKQHAAALLISVVKFALELELESSRMQ